MEVPSWRDRAALALQKLRPCELANERIPASKQGEEPYYCCCRRKVHRKRYNSDWQANPLRGNDKGLVADGAGVLGGSTVCGTSHGCSRDSIDASKCSDESFL